MKKIISLATSIVIIISCILALTFNVSASGSSVIAFSKKTADVGDTVTVTVSVSANEPMYAVQFALQYDQEVLKFQSGDSCSGGAGVLTVVDALDGVKKKSLSYSFKAIKAGSCYISTADTVYVNESYQEVSVSNQGATLTVKDITLSNNASLKSLKVGGATLSPAFSASTRSYKVTVEKSVTDCNIYAVASDSDAKVKVEGGSNLKVGDNSCKVTVTAPNGNQKVYKIVITRKKADKVEQSSSESVSSEDTSSNEETSPEGSLETEIEGEKFTVVSELKSIKIPSGFEKSLVSYNDQEVSVAKDKDGNYTIYYLKNNETKKIVPYTLDEETKTFEKLSYIEQNGKYYIFAETPEDFILPKGYYVTGKMISDFNINCYANENPELADFYYVYCYNGTDYSFYRYDSLENIIQRYPDIELAVSVFEEETPKEENGIIDKFLSLTTNAKIVVLGFLALVLFGLILIVLLVFKILSKRGQARFVSELGYDDFDDVQYNGSFSLANGGFLTEDDDDDEIMEDEPEYLLDDKTKK